MAYALSGGCQTRIQICKKFSKLYTSRAYVTKLLDIWSIRVSRLRMEGSRFISDRFDSIFSLNFVSPSTESTKILGTQAQLLFLTTI